METSCLFLYRKIANKNFKPSLLAAPKMRGTDEEVEVFLDEYKRIAETLEVGDGAAPADAAASEADSQDESVHPLKDAFGCLLYCRYGHDKVASHILLSCGPKTVLKFSDEAQHLFIEGAPHISFVKDSLSYC